MKWPQGGVLNVHNHTSSHSNNVTSPNPLTGTNRILVTGLAFFGSYAMT